MEVLPSNIHKDKHRKMLQRQPSNKGADGPMKGNENTETEVPGPHSSLHISSNVIMRKLCSHGRKGYNLIIFRRDAKKGNCSALREL